jgi:hypothetical protein
MTNVYDIATKAKVQSVTVEPTKPEYTERELGLFKALRSVLNDITEAQDQSWLDCEHDYRYLIEDDLDAVIKQFSENYSSKKIGFIEFDDLTGEQITERVSHEILVRALLEHSEFEPCDYYIQWNEIGSISIGETEHLIDVESEGPELHKCLAMMSDADLEKFYQWTGYLKVKRESFFVYGNPCERLVLKVDAEALLSDPAVVNELRAFERSSK